MQYGCAQDNPLWGVALFPGAYCWCVLQTAPLELLGKRAPGQARMRLAELCRRLGLPGFHFNVYDGSASVLAEISETCAIAMSGFRLDSDGDHPLSWNGQALPQGEALFLPSFQMLPFQHVLEGAECDEDAAVAIARTFGGRNAVWCDNRTSLKTLLCHEPFAASGGRTLYFARHGYGRPRAGAERL
jgi:hypothetical protein